MKSLCIKTNDTNLLQYLLNELKNIDLDDICFSYNQFKHYKNVIIHYSGNDSELFITEISNILSLLVIDELETTFLERIIIQNYFYFDAIERKQILDICFSVTANDFTEIFDKKFRIIFNSFYSYLTYNKSIVLHGFTNFRLKEYFFILDDIVNEAVTNFVVEKEYLEFISLLKLYVSSQKSTCNAVHMFYSTSESLLMDENKNIIDISNNVLKAKYLSDISFSSNDYILNSLLTLIPEKLYIHLPDNNLDEFIHTLLLVFENRVTLCNE